MRLRDKKLTMIELQMRIAQLKEVAERAKEAGHTATARECVKCAGIYARRVARMQACDGI